MKAYLKFIFICYLLLFSVFVFGGDKQDTLLIHKSLKTLDGKVFEFSDFTKNKASILVFMAPDCPISQKYTLTLREIAEKYKDRNIPIYLIFPGTYYTKKVIREFTKKYMMVFPVLLDEKLLVTKLLRATITPEAFLFDSLGNHLYSGRIDNWFESLGKSRFVITERDLQSAMDSYFMGEAIKVKKTKSVGCIIQY
jgi:thiol-disulfide isomerase/thioredoxin